MSSKKQDYQVIEKFPETKKQDFILCALGLEDLELYDIKYQKKYNLTDLSIFSSKSFNFSKKPSLKLRLSERGLKNLELVHNKITTELKNLFLNKSKSEIVYILAGKSPIDSSKMNLPKNIILFDYLPPGKGKIIQKKLELIFPHKNFKIRTSLGLKRTQHINQGKYFQH